MAGRPLVETNGISKDFNNVYVLRDIDFVVLPGEIHAVVGENGAGKSTLMKIIGGVYEPTKGEIRINNRLCSITSPQIARDLGIALIHQEPLIFTDLNVTENIFIGHTRNRRKVFIDRKQMYIEAENYLKALDVHLSPKEKMKNVSIADQQMVEIISALSQHAKTIIMDEPTAALTPEEAGKLFDIVRRLRESGTSFVFISHRLDEVLEIADTITVLRDGRKVGTWTRADLTKHELIRHMIGRTMAEHIQKTAVEVGETVFSVENISLRGVFKDISFTVHKGEILGIAGLVGAGRSEVARSIFGITPIDSGRIMRHGKAITIKKPDDAIKYGISYLPEDRQNEGLFLPFSTCSNISFTVPELISKYGIVDKNTEIEIAEKFRKQFNIQLRGVKQEVRELSGGNQQKVLLAKWLIPEPEVLILDEPTRGIDVGAKEEVYRVINELAAQGKGIIMISSELPEIIGMSDRILVMWDGRISGELPAGSSEADIMKYAIGIPHDDIS